MKDFTEDELECVAESSYSYWYSCKTGEITDQVEMREGMALREIARYFDAAKEDPELTLKALKITCGFRQEYRIDIIRSCLDDDVMYKNKDDEELAKKYRNLISTELAIQPMLVKAGTTGRGVLSIGPRSSSERDDEGYILSLIYMIERAVAATESLSKGAETQMDVIIDANSVKSKFSPSRSTLKRLIHILQNHYCQRLGTLVVLDPPFWLSTLWSVISVFVDKRTRNKLQLARGDEAKEKLLGQVLQFPSNEEGSTAAEVKPKSSFEMTDDSLQEECLVPPQ